MSDNGSNNNTNDMQTLAESYEVEADDFYTPAQVEKHLDFIAFNKDGQMLLGSSNLTGRYWCGSIWYYTDPFAAPDIEKSKAGLEYRVGVADCSFIDNKRAIVAQDGGLIDFITIKECEDNTFKLERTERVEDHDNEVFCVKVTCDSKYAITVGMDASIRLWDCCIYARSHNFCPAHSQQVTSVAPHPSEPQIFLSCSLDGTVLLWDLRVKKPALCIYNDVNDFPSTVAWSDCSERSKLDCLVGTVSGNLLLRDTKAPYGNVDEQKPFNRPIHRIENNPRRKKQFGVCADETKVKIFNVVKNKITTRYESDSHDDMVRGLAWVSEDCLLSCGWDKRIVSHILSEK